VIGRSICVNEEGSRQIEEVLNAQGVELIRVDLNGYNIHIDGALTMIDIDVAIVDPDQLPYWFLVKLAELGIKTVEVTAQDSGWIINCLAVGPGRVVMPRGISNRTMDRLADLDIDIIEIDYDKIHHNGGGIHCSTCPLVRDAVD
jgi:N-dimethylarginine dimethylaminohydrolase